MESWQLSLSFGFNFLLPCLKAITAASCQNRHGTRCTLDACAVFLAVATSQYLKWCTTSPPGSAPSFHTTSGTVGLPPSSGGGLHRCSLLHISERTLRKMRTGCVWAARHVRCALTSVHNSVGHKWDLFQFLQKAGCFSCPCTVYENEGLDSCLKTMMH